jgi:hypothetical protein
VEALSSMAHQLRLVSPAATSPVSLALTRVDRQGLYDRRAGLIEVL